jgi:hypothetical protein
VTRKAVTGVAGGTLVLLAAAVAGSGLAGPAVDTGLCPFPLSVAVTTRGETPIPVLKFTLANPTTITLRNQSTGHTKTLRATGPSTVDTRTGTVYFAGLQLWFWSAGDKVPFLATESGGRFVAPDYALRGASRAEVLDPCVLVAPSPPALPSATSREPWGLPRYALSRIGKAGLLPLIGRLVRHDHVHLDVIVDGRRVTIPAGVGLAEPVDAGPCPSSTQGQGDCATRHVYVAKVANSPLHTHSASGIIHVEPDRPGTYTLGQFFDEWGVRLTPTCVGAYCAGGGKELRAFVDGRRVANPREIVLRNRQEIALVYGPPSAFRHVAARYAGGWPGLGCGGPGESPC